MIHYILFAKVGMCVEKEKDKNIKLDDNTRISHRNILWLVYRALSEEINMDTTETNENDNKRRNIDE